MLQTIEAQSNTKTLDEMLADLFVSGREYWQMEAQFGPIPADIADQYGIDQSHWDDMADYQSQVNSGIAMF